jgi:hypothetical protein
MSFVILKRYFEQRAWRDPRLQICFYVNRLTMSSRSLMKFDNQTQ